VALAEPVLSGRLTCTEQPQSILTTLMLPYLRTGQTDRARDAHRRAYRLHRPHLADLADVAEHIGFCARTGNEARAVEIVQRHLSWLGRAPSPWAAMMFAAWSALALRRAGAGPQEVVVHRPGHGERPAVEISAASLAEQLTGEATTIAERFDRRNGTEQVGAMVRDILEAQPLVDYLPLSRSGSSGDPGSAASIATRARRPE
jgi:hypothetical protein